MQELGVSLNVYSFSNVIKSFTSASALWQRLKIHALLIKNGVVDSSIHGTSLVDMYFKCGKIKLAHCIFEEIGERDVVVWGAMIAGCTSNGKLEQALRSII
ncbi:pentatricopeptide repeat-containing protein [Quercus suber]|uniref:Pentatricopeptide repeat-containing protein n=1 Tax=Quercus suber TaxID=58331 RepID=A0AAW0LI30_QUESU